MKHSVRLTIAILLTVLLILTGVGVWAAPKLQGTVPAIPVTGGEPAPEGQSIWAPRYLSPNPPNVP